MASLVLSGDTSGSITVAAPAVAGSNTQTLAAVTGTLAPVVSGTFQTAPFAVNTYADFTGIPPWVKRVTVMFQNVSTNGSSNLLVQLGDAGGLELTNYASAVGNNAASTTSTSAFIVTSNGAAGSFLSGAITISLINTNTWVCGVTLGDTSGTQTPYAGGGSKALSDTLTQLRVTTVNGLDTFDTGSTINILYE